MAGILVFAAMIAVAAFICRGKTRNLGAISVRDWIIYLVAGLLVVGVAILSAEYDLNFNLDNRWIFICTSALFAFGFLLQPCRAHSKNWRFWVLFLGMLSVHFAFLALKIPPQKQISFLLAPVIGIAEGVFVSIVLTAMGFRPVFGNVVADKKQ